MRYRRTWKLFLQILRSGRSSERCTAASLREAPPSSSTRHAGRIVHHHGDDILLRLQRRDAQRGMPQHEQQQRREQRSAAARPTPDATPATRTEPGARLATPASPARRPPPAIADSQHPHRPAAQRARRCLGRRPAVGYLKRSSNMASPLVRQIIHKVVDRDAIRQAPPTFPDTAGHPTTPTRRPGPYCGRSRP